MEVRDPLRGGKDWLMTERVLSTTRDFLTGLCPDQGLDEVFTSFKHVSPARNKPARRVIWQRKR